MNESNETLSGRTLHESLDRLAGAADRYAAGAAIGGQLGEKQDQDQFVTLSLQVMANLNFAYAIGAAMRGHRITRRGWNAAGQYVFRHHPDKRSELREAFMAIKNAQGIFVPWVPSQGDMAAQDWAIIPIQPIHC
jgi:hypothetical protein